MRLHERWTTVQGLDLVGALLTADAQIHEREPTSILVGDIEARNWNFHQRTKGGEPVSKLRNLWHEAHEPQGEDWTQSQRMREAIAKVPDEVVFAIATWAIDNRRWAQRKQQERSGSTCVILDEKRRLVLGPNMTKEHEELICRKAGV